MQYNLQTSPTYTNSRFPIARVYTCDLFWRMFIFFIIFQYFQLLFQLSFYTEKDWINICHIYRIIVQDSFHCIVTEFVLIFILMKFIFYLAHFKSIWFFPNLATAIILHHILYGWRAMIVLRKKIFSSSTSNYRFSFERPLVYILDSFSWRDTTGF